MDGRAYARNSILSLGDYNSYFRVGKYLYDPSGRSAVYYLKSLDKEQMKKHLMSQYTKEALVDMLLNFVENGSDHLEATA